MPRVLIRSDLHLDKVDGFPELDEQPGDHLIIAGDLRDNLKKARRFLPEIVERFAPGRVFVVPGNHDYWSACLDDDERLGFAVEECGAVWGQRAEAIIEGDRYLMCTLWTDMRAGQAQEKRNLLAHEAETRMNDYRYIRMSGSYRKASVLDTLRKHEGDLSWLRGALERPFSGRTFVVTHHAPVMEAAGDDLPQAYASDLKDLIIEAQPDGWYFGHTHLPLNMTIGRTVIQNVSVMGVSPEIYRSAGVITPLDDPDPFLSA